MGTEETYQEFRRVWAASPTMLENVRPGDLPNSFEVFLKDNGDSAAWVRSFQALRLGNIYDVRDAEMGPTVLDALVWPGHDPDARPDASTLASLLYDKNWPDKAAAVATAARAVGDERLTEAVEALAAEVAERPQTPRVAGSTVSVDAAAAAAVVEATAANRCRQIPLEVFANGARERSGN
jgi:CO/xanthine dehydrogenase Mo-binding subunit